MKGTLQLKQSGIQNVNSLENSECNLCDPEKRYIDIENYWDDKGQRRNSNGETGGDIFDTKQVRGATYRDEGAVDDGAEKPLKFLILPSFLAGCFLGTNNFFLGFISDLGINAATLFSLGAFIFTTLYKLVEACRMKSKHGSFFPYQYSNFFKENPKTGKAEIKWICVGGLAIRSLFNISF